MTNTMNNTTKIKNVLIIGLGSMGKRRARLINGIDKNICVYGVDMTKQRREDAEKLGIVTFSSIQEAVSKEEYSAAFVCTAPITHAAIINDLLDANLHVFTELNLVSTNYSELINKAAQKKLHLFLSNTMLYRKEIQYIKSSVDDFNGPLNYIYHIGQYLPDWHPWESYKNFFVGDKRTSGVREIFGIDLPWLTETFGQVVSVNAQSDKLSSLEIDYDDTYYVILRHANGTKGFLAADVVSPKAVRNFEMFGEGLHIFWHGNPSWLFKYDTQSKQNVQINTYNNVEHNTKYSDNIVENAYVDEILNFFDVLCLNKTPLWSFEKDEKVIELIEKIESEAQKTKGL